MTAKWNIELRMNPDGRGKAPKNNIESVDKIGIQM